MKTKPRGRCEECKGTGEHKQRNGPTLKCTECNGTGESRNFEMIFWSYGHFPFFLASRGFVLDDGMAYCPSYNCCFRPLRVMSLKDGAAFKAKIDELEKERRLLLDCLENNYRYRLKIMAPWAVKKLDELEP